MSHAVTRYQFLYESLASRRRRPIVPTGLDAIAAVARVKLRHARITRAWLHAQARQTDALAPTFRAHSDAALDQEIERVRETFVLGRHADEHLRVGLALVREVARRQTGQEAFLVQLMGALALAKGQVIEMLTGEGKTLTGSLAATLIAWQRRHVHIFTVNDYLASRDAESRRPIYARCKVSVGAIVQEMEPGERAPVYARGIVYGTPKQIVADWLRDQIRMGRLTTAWAGRQAMEALGPQHARAVAPMVPGLRAALVDEADAVLIDEGVVPLIIARSRRDDDMGATYRLAAELAQKLDEGPDYEIDHLQRRAELKRRGTHRLRAMFEEHAQAAGGAIFRATRRGEELVRQALVARHCYLHGQQYQIVDGKVMLVDEYTGRFLADRQWEHGLHQAVEAKEGLDVTADRETLARMSFQRFYRSYPFLCGMTGTAADATGEIRRVYSRPVIVIPTNRPVRREGWPARIFRTARDKWQAIANSIEQIHATGRPILVGTRSINASELLSRLLTERGLPHQVLNAKHDKEEAGVVGLAGRGSLPMECAVGESAAGLSEEARRVVEAAGDEFAPRSGPAEGALRDALGRAVESAGGTRADTGIAAITVATNMAGRGTDIELDARAREKGGLHVILTEMHGAKRIDRQFIGRAGRQGDPGSAQMFLSLEDELITKFVPVLARALRMRAKSKELGLGPRPAPTPGEIRASRHALAVFRFAQRLSEARDRRNRASVLRQDDWIDKHLPGA